MRVPFRLAENNLFRICLFAFFAAWLLLFGYPLLSVMREALSGPSLQNSLFSGDSIAITLFTARQAFLSTLISILLGAPLGVGLGVLLRKKLHSRGVWSLLALPYAVPTVVVGITWIAWLGASGLLAKMGWKLEWLYSVEAILLAHVFLNLPWVALICGQPVSRIPKAQWEAMRTLGAEKLDFLKYLIWPEIRLPLGIASAHVFSLCTMSFAIIVLLGGGAPVETLETAIFTSMRFSHLDVSHAAGFAIWQFALTLVPWLLLVILEYRSGQSFFAPADFVEVHHTGFRPGFRSDSRKRIFGRLMQRVAPAMIFTLPAFFVLPYGILLMDEGILRILLDTEFLKSLWPSLWVSLRLSSFTALMTLLLTACALIVLSLSKRKWMRAIVPFAVAAPAGVSILVVSLGFWLAYGEWIDPFEGSLSAMIAVQVALYLPVSFRMLWPHLTGFQKNLFEAARTSGAGIFKAFYWAEWPRWKRPVLIVLGLVFAASLGEVAAVSLFYSEKLVPLPMLILWNMQQYRYEEAQAIAALLLLLVSFIFLSSYFQPSRKRP